MTRGIIAELDFSGPDELNREAMGEGKGKHRGITKFLPMSERVMEEIKDDQHY